MCNLCTARRQLTESLKQADGAGNEDIALPFALFSDSVTEEKYDKELKIKMLQLALSLWEGYLPLTQQEFERKLGHFHLPTDHPEIRLGMKDAMLEIFSIFGNRLPWAFYGGYLFMVTREQLNVPERLPDLKDSLPSDLPWECVDAVWHGLPPATDLYIYLLSIISRHTGRIPRHGCGCNHYLPPLPSGPRESIACIPLEKGRILEETEVPVSHILLAIESLVRGLPHAFSCSTKKLARHQKHRPFPVIEQAALPT